MKLTKEEIDFVRAGHLSQLQPNKVFLSVKHNLYFKISKINWELKRFLEDDIILIPKKNQNFLSYGLPSSNSKVRDLITIIFELCRKAPKKPFQIKNDDMSMEK